MVKTAQGRSNQKMGEACRTHRKIKMHTEHLSGHRKGRVHLEDLGVDSTILKLIFIWLKIGTSSELT